MRFTPTSNWLSIAKSAGVDVRWHLYLKKTTALNDALGSGTWVEVTNRLADWPDISTAIEMETGQFTADEVTFRGVNRAWWNANIFDATAYIEGKIVLDIGRGGTLATDAPVLFAGFVRKNPIIDEDDDTVEFSLATPETLADEMSAERITTQYIDDDIDGSGTDGLILPEVVSLYVKNANVSSYVLQTGIHAITYQYNGGSRRAQLDGGLWVSLTGAGTYTLGNGAASTSDDTQRVEVYVKTGAGSLPSADAEAKIVVVTAGTTLPSQFYHGTHVLPLLRAMFAVMGIDSVSYGTLEYTSHDSTNRTTFLDQPPQTGNIVGYKYAMASDGTNLWIGVGNKFYKRTMASHSYTLKSTLNSGDRIEKIIYIGNQGHIWLWVRTSTGGAEVRRFTISSDTMSSAVTCSNGDRDSFQVFDYSGAGDPQYCGLYVDTANKYIKRIDGSALTLSTVFTNADLGFTGSGGPETGFSYIRSSNYGFAASDLSGSYNYEIYWDMANWSINGSFTKPSPGYNVAALHVSEDRIYFWDPVNFKVKKHPRTSTTATDVLTLDSYATVYEFWYLSTGYVYFSTRENYAAGTLKTARIYTVTNSALTLINETPAIYTRYFTFAYISPAVFGLDQNGRLFAIASKIYTCVENADFDGLTVREAFNKILVAANATAIINAKRGILYRRGNDSGTAETTGSSVTLTKSNTGQPLIRTTEFQPAMAIVRVSNGLIWASYNGTAFNQNVATDAARIEVENQYIPSEIIKDLAYRMFQFFKTKRDKITVPVLDVAVEYEPFDGVTLTGFDEVSSATGVIAGQIIHDDGTADFEILTPKG